MSVDLTDPNIPTAYDSIIKHHENDWLLLTYGKTRDRLTLLASGTGGVDALRARIPNAQDDVFFGFCREEENGRNYYVLIAYVPEGVSGVRRARALVHSRAVGALLKAHQGTLSANKLNQINIENVRERLHLGPSYIPRANTNGRIQRSTSEPMDMDSMRNSPPPMSTRGTVSEFRPVATSMGRVVSQPVRRLQGSDEEDPPPTPPKDKSLISPSTSEIPNKRPNGSSEQLPASSSAFGQPGRPRASSRSDLAYLSNDDDEVVIGGARRPSEAHSRSASAASTARVPVRPMSPAERARLRAEAFRQREAEEQEALREEAERQARLKREKEETLRRAAVEEERRKMMLEEEKRFAMAERARREAEREEEEERRLRETETKRQADRARRMQEAKRLEDARREDERRKEEAKRRKEEQRRAAEEEKKEKMKMIQGKFQVNGGPDPVLLAGNVTVQTSMSITWKRRFFELNGNALLFYKDSQDRTQPLDIMDLKGGRVRAIREPSDGYEELEAIPHSFAVEFQDGDGAWLLFADCAEDKDILMSLVSQAAGLS